MRVTWIIPMFGRKEGQVEEFSEQRLAAKTMLGRRRAADRLPALLKCGIVTAATAAAKPAPAATEVSNGE